MVFVWASPGDVQRWLLALHPGITWWCLGNHMEEQGWTLSNHMQLKFWTVGSKGSRAGDVKKKKKTQTKRKEPQIHALLVNSPGFHLSTAWTPSTTGYAPHGGKKNEDGVAFFCPFTPSLLRHICVLRTIGGTQRNNLHLPPHPRPPLPTSAEIFVLRRNKEMIQ